MYGYDPSFPDGCLTDQGGRNPQQVGLLQKGLENCLPAVAEALFIGLAGLVDTAMVSTMGDAAVAAVGLCSQPKFVCLCLVTSSMWV